MLARVSDVTYRIQWEEDAPAYVVHVDKIDRYLPDFGVTLTPWAIPAQSASVTVSTQTDSAPLESGRSADLDLVAVPAAPQATVKRVETGPNRPDTTAELTPRSVVYPLLDKDDTDNRTPGASAPGETTPAPGPGRETLPVKRRAGRPAKAKRPLSAPPALIDDHQENMTTQAATPAAGHP